MPVVPLTDEHLGFSSDANQFTKLPEMGQRTISPCNILIVVGHSPYIGRSGYCVAKVRYRSVFAVQRALRAARRDAAVDEAGNGQELPFVS